MKGENAMTPLMVLLLLLPLSSSSFGLAPPEQGSAEELLWSHPATVHDFKKKSDLHSLIATVMAFSELEFLRIGDGLIGWSLRRKERPLKNSADYVEKIYHGLPQIPPVQRLAQLVDALQIRQFSLSDARAWTVVASGSGGGITPIMQTRLYKLLVWGEDVIDDTDRLLMLPLSAGISYLRREDLRFKSLGYTADGIGFLREKTFTGLRAANRLIVRSGSRAVYGVEGLENQAVRMRRSQKNKHFILYLRMPYSVYRSHEKFFGEKVKRKFAGSASEWQTALSRNFLPDNLFVKNVPWFGPLKNLNPEEPVFIATTLGDWKKAPKELKAYVIDHDEFINLINNSVPGTEVHLT